MVLKFGKYKTRLQYVLAFIIAIYMAILAGSYLTFRAANHVAPQLLCDVINTNKGLANERFCKSVESVEYDNLRGYRIEVMGMDDLPHIYYLNRS